MGVAVVATASFAVAFPRTARAATATWTGTTDGLWSDAGNWGGTLPVNGDDLVFPSVATTSATTDDLAALTSVNSITFTGDLSLGNNYSISAGGAVTSLAITASGGADDVIDSQSAGNGACNGIDMPITSTSTNFTVHATTASAFTCFGSTVTDANPLTVNAVNSSPLVWFSGSDTFTSATITAGTRARTDNATGFGTGTVTVGAGAIAELDGPFTMTNGWTVNGGNVFDVSGAVTLSGAIALGAANSALTSTGGANLITTGAITGAQTLATYGTGRVTFDNAGNTFSALHVGQGVSTALVTAEAAGCLGAGTVTITDGSQLNFSIAALPDQTFSNPIDVTGTAGAGSVTIGPGNSNRVILTGAMALHGSGVFINGTNSYYLEGLISGNGVPLEVSSNALLDASGDDTYNGALTLDGFDILTGGVLAMGGTSLTITPASLVSFNSANTVPTNVDVQMGAGSSLHFNANTYTFNSLNLTGATADLHSGGPPATLILSGDLTATSAGGSSATVGGGAAGIGTLSLPGGNHNAVVASGGTSPDLQITSLISGGGALTFSGAGLTRLTADNTYSGGTTIGAGTVEIEGAQTGDVALNGGTLGGNGSVHNLIATGGTVAPGNSPGTFTANNVTWNSSTTLASELNGTTAGSQYDQLIANGSVNLGGATLALSTGFTPAAGDTFTILKNSGGAAITGTFGGLAEGSEFTMAGTDWQITYNGNGGHDVVLTALTSFTTSVGLTVSPNPASTGEAVMLSATVTSAGPGSPTGEVRFYDGATLLGSSEIIGDVAGFPINNLSAGAHSITAQYLGDSNFGGSTSAVVVETINAVSVPATGASVGIGLLLILLGLGLVVARGRRRPIK